MRTTRRPRPTALIVVFAAAIPALGGPLAPPPGPVAPTHKTLSQVEPRTPISSLPFVITQPGSYYVTSDLTGVPGHPGITIAVSDVTIDLNGFTLRGVPTSLSGIQQAQANGLRNITVRNGVVREWNNFGVIVAESSRVENITARNNHSSGITAGPGSLVTGCLAIFNGGHGISLLLDGTVTNCAAQLNDLDGISVGENAVVTGCSTRQNDRDGFAALAGAILENCTSKDDHGDGFDVGRNSTIRACNARTSAGAGFRVTIGATVESCNASSCATGIVADRLCRIQSNHCTDGQVGIHLTGADNVLDSNTVINNDFRGIDIDAAGNLVIRNIARGNAANYSIVASNHLGVLTIAPTSAAVNGSTGGAGVGTTNAFANLSF